MKKYYNVVYTRTDLDTKQSSVQSTVYETEFFIPTKFAREEVIKLDMRFREVPPYAPGFKVEPTFWTEITEEEAKQIEAYRD
jgi:hypothetical protein